VRIHSKLAEQKDLKTGQFGQKRDLFKVADTEGVVVKDTESQSH
jgi:hypothetical protein